MEFRIDGDTGDGAALPRMVKKIIEMAEGLPDKEFLSSRGMAERIGTTPGGLVQHTAHPALRPYKVRQPKTNRNLFGNAATVRAFKEEFYGEK